MKRLANDLEDFLAMFEVGGRGISVDTGHMGCVGDPPVNWGRHRLLIGPWEQTWQ